MPLLNQQNIFTSAEMTDAVNKLPRTAHRFASMFENTGVRTTNINIELLHGRLTLISDSPRGSTPDYLGTKQPKREMKVLSATHLAQADVLAPEDIQDVRAFGSTELATPAQVVAQKLAAMKRNLDQTLEYHRLGAVKGKVMDPDGRVLHDIHATFGAAKKTQEINFNPATANKDNPVLTALIAAKRKAEEGMAGNPYTRLEAIVGSNFYDMLTGNKLVRDAYNLWAANLASFGDNDYRKRGFTYAGITFYEASEVVGGKKLVDDNKGHLFPLGSGIWRSYYAPADWMETANTVGRAYYARMDERPRSRGYDMEVQSNPLTLCLFPEALVELTAKAV